MTLRSEIWLPADILFGKPEGPKKSACDYIANIENKIADLHRTVRKNIAVDNDQVRYDR